MRNHSSFLSILNLLLVLVSTSPLPPHTFEPHSSPLPVTGPLWNAEASSASAAAAAASLASRSLPSLRPLTSDFFCSPDNSSSCNACTKSGNDSSSHLLTARSSVIPLEKRSLVPPTKFEDMDKFMANRFLFATTLRQGDFTDPTTAASAPWGLHDVIVGVDRLSGCTSLIVTSRKGVYMTHYFEVPSMRARHEIPQKEQDFIFRRQVLATLDGDWDYGLVGRRKYVLALKPLVEASSAPSSPNTGGVPYDHTPGTPSNFDTPAKKLFTAQDHVRAVIVSPRTPFSRVKGVDFLFPRYVDALAERVRQILPPESLIERAEYHKAGEIEEYMLRGPRQRRKYLMASAMAKVLVQYSPDQGYEVYASRNAQPVLSDYWNNTQALMEEGAL